MLILIFYICDDLIVEYLYYLFKLKIIIWNNHAKNQLILFLKNQYFQNWITYFPPL